MSLSNYLEALADLRVVVTDDDDCEVAIDIALEWVVERCQRIRDTHRVFFVGNGGSAAIASHMAADWMKNGAFAAMAFNDAPLLTCITNDIGYDEVFSLPIARHVYADDVLFAISSSGESQNIVEAAHAAVDAAACVITLSGFAPDNTLRRRGEMNFYVPSAHYGFIEIKHLTILHAILDHCMGWKSV